MSATNEYIEQVKNVLKQKKNADIYILNDKLTLSVFSVLEQSLKNVRRIYLIIRGNQQLPKGEVAREFEMNPNDTLYNEYDIVEKNELTHFAKAKSMHDFISKNVEIRRLNPKVKAGFNIMIIDEDFMIAGTSSLELNERKSEQSINFNSVIDSEMDKSQIIKFKNEFERIWLSDGMTYDFKNELLSSLAYVYKEHSPEFAYYFTLNELYGNKIDESVQQFERDNSDFKESKIWNMLFDFQKEAVQYAIQKINTYNGCIIADSVGLGKTFEALSVIKYFSDRQDNILVLTPSKLYNNWDSYRDNDYEDNPLADDKIRYKVLCHTDLSRYSGYSRSGIDLERFDWSRFDLIVIDESHKFRNRTEKEESETRYQRLLETVVKKKTHTKVLLLSATPVNNSLTDLKNQISLITGDRDDAYAKFGIESISQTLRKASTVFNIWERSGNATKEELYDSLPKDFFDLLELITISRSRKHITNYYNSADIGSFPEKLPVSTYNPNIDTEQKLLNFKDTLTTLEDLLLSAYTPMMYIKRELVASEYVKINKSGKIIMQKSDEDFRSIEFNDPVLIEHSEKIKDSFVKAMKEKGSKKIEIANGDEPTSENTIQKYVKENEFYKMYQKLLAIFQKRSVYRYKLDKDEFIRSVTWEIDRKLARKNDFIQFEVTKAEVDFNESRKMRMTDAQKQIEDSESYTATYEEKPLFDIVNIIMANTMLPRLAIIKIINGLSAKTRYKINNQDYLEEAIKIINEKLKEFKSKEFLTAELIEGVCALEKDIFEVDKIVNESEIKYLFTPNPSHRKAMNLKYKFDSDGELKFAKALDDDPNVLLYTKLKKGGFVLETPAGNYSPDWAIVYQKDNDNFAMYFIAETKWDKDAGGLNDDERIKIKCATKHFEAVNQSVNEVVKYAWVNAYKDTTKDRSFPQVFIDENYTDTLPIERF